MQGDAQVSQLSACVLKELTVWLKTRTCALMWQGQKTAVPQRRQEQNASQGTLGVWGGTNVGWDAGSLESNQFLSKASSSLWSKK